MKKQSLILAMALLGLLPAACNKKTPIAENPGNPAKPAEVSLEPKLRAAYGFAVQVPSNSEGYAAFYGVGKLWKDIKQSKTLAAILANPLVHQATANPSVQQAKAMVSSNPEAGMWRAIASDVFGNEAFIEFAPGSAEKLRLLMQVSDEMRMANIQNSIAGGKAAKSGENLPAALLPYLKTLDMPPVVLGFKLTSQKAALGAQLERGEKNLPPGVELTTFNVNGNVPFKSIVVTVGKVLPPPQQEQLKQWITANTPDPKQADDTYQALLARHLEVAYGFLGDYFVASIGADHSHLKFASNFGESILSKPEVAVAANYADKPVFSFSWSSAELIAASQRKFEMMAYYERFKAAITKVLSPADAQKLADDLKRLDGESQAVIARDFTPMVGVSYRDHGLRSEGFGGIKATGATGAVKFSSVPSDSTFLWMDSQSNPVFGAALRTWVEDFSTTSYDTFQRVGLQYLTDEQKAQFTLFQTEAVPRITELYKISRDQFVKSLGSENAMALDLAGPMPDVPMIPPPIHDGGRMVRLAYLSDVKDRALLGQSWDSYMKFARGLAQVVPQTAMFGALPDPVSETVDGVVLSYFKLPMPTGDLLPNIATTDKTFVVSTSRSYALELTKAAAKSAPGAKPLTFDFRMNSRAAFDFVDKWMAIAAQFPALFFKGDQAKAEEFRKAQPDIAALLRSLRSFEGMDVQVYEENGLRRISSAIRWHEQAATPQVAQSKN